MKAKYCSFKPLIPCFEQEHPVDWHKMFGRVSVLEVEIGFGLGEILIRKAKENPDRQYVGLEQNWERICKILRAVTLQGSTLKTDPRFGNIRILQLDARVAFKRLFASKSIDHVYCLFPCPWPKESHIKHRLFSNDFLKLLNSRLKEDGHVKIVTDFEPYYQWILEQSGNKGFEIFSKTVRPQYDTKFEKKWKEEGQHDFFEICFEKKKHIHIAVEKDIILKSYTTQHFDPNRFQFDNITGAVSVVLKDTFYDPKKQKALFHTIVAEQSLTQHFWVTAIKKKDVWRVCRAEGQNFFPTPGTAEALRLIYEAVKAS